MRSFYRSEWIPLFLVCVAAGSWGVASFSHAKPEGPSEAGLQVCNSIPSYSSEVMSCLQIIQQAKRVDEHAASVCQSVPYSMDKNRCLRTIADKSFDKDGVSVCSKMANISPTETISCLATIADHRVETQAADACGLLAFSTDKTECMAKIIDKRFDTEAAKFCGSLASYPTGMKSCMGAIAGKDYITAEVELCKGRFPSDAKVECMKAAGRPMGPEKKPEEVAQHESCQKVVAKIDGACKLPKATEEFLLRKAEVCDTAVSESKKTVMHGLLRRDTGELLVVNSKGNQKCKIQQIQFSGTRVRDINTVKGEHRSDKMFVRVQSGQLFFVDLGQQIFEVQNAQGESYHIESLKDLGNETIELDHRAGNKSQLTFEDIDQRRKEGKVDEVKTHEIPSWEELLKALSW